MVIGSITGEFAAVLSKLSALNSKNAFSLAIVVGNLFADPEDDDAVNLLLRGSYDIPLPTYFGAGSHALPTKVVEKLESTAGELCPNLFYIGKRSIFKTSEGLKIAALGGILNPETRTGTSEDKYLPFYTEGDARALHSAKTADVLITYEWPKSIRNGSKATLSAEEEPVSQACVADLCSALKPRYHFSTSNNTFFEREPFYHETFDSSSNDRSVTRFISLAAFGNPKKAKWIYAFSIDPRASSALELPADATVSPLVPAGRKRSHAEQQNASYRFSTEDNHTHRRHKHRRHPPPTPGECFFCLSNPNLATHFIVSIATEAYLTTAKGPLTTATTFPELKFPGHVLIIPMTHSPTLASITDLQARNRTYNEMERYRKALQKMIEVTANSSLGAVTWEISRANGIHAHWQFLPVPIDLINRGLVEAAYKVEAENGKYPAIRNVENSGAHQDAEDFFKVLIWRPATFGSGSSSAAEESRETCLSLPLDGSFRFDLQFGRKVLAKLLNLESRMDWQSSGQSEQDEVSDAEAFKASFEKFDFSLGEEADLPTAKT